MVIRYALISTYVSMQGAINCLYLIEKLKDSLKEKSSLVKASFPFFECCAFQFKLS
jgi:ribosome biogenesis protein Nip4